MNLSDTITPTNQIQRLYRPGLYLSYSILKPWCVYEFGFKLYGLFIRELLFVRVHWAITLHTIKHTQE